MQPFIQALPLTALIDALRGVMNEGLSLGALCERARDSGGLGRDPVRAGVTHLPLAVSGCAVGPQARSARTALRAVGRAFRSST